MAVRVKGPDGVITEFPDGTPEAKINAVMGQIYGTKTRDGERESRRLQTRSTFLDVSARFNNAVTFGLGDEVSGAASVIANALVAPFSDRVDFDPVGAFRRGQREFKDDMARAARVAPVASGIADVAGTVASIGRAPVALARAAGLGQAVRAGAKGGAITGAISGAGNSDGGLMERGAAALGGSVLGGVVGGALPLAGRMAASVIDGARRLAGRGPSVAPQVVANALAADGGARRAARIVNDAKTRGVPLALADTGDNARGIAASVGRQPGEARTIVRDMAIGRQEAQGERIAGAVVRDLGAVANPREVSERLIQQARQQSEPLYAAALNRPRAPNSPLFDKLLNRPSLRAALARAERIAAEEGRDPRALGFDLDQQGNTILTSKPSWETLHYVKLGMDDVIEARRDPLTGRLKLDEEGRAINQTLRTFLGEFDRLNPEYAAARAAYAGPAKMATALAKGEKALTRTADDITAMTRDMTPAELDQFRLGIRAAIVRQIEGRGDYADKVRALVGTPAKRATLARLFGGNAEFDRFLATLADESRATQTYAAVAGNSATAERQAFDAATGDQGLVNIATNAAVNGVVGRPITAIMQALSDLRNYGAGEAGKRVRAEVAAALSETDPAVLREALRQAARSEARRRVAGRSEGRASVAAGRATGNVAGSTINALAAPRD